MLFRLYEEGGLAEYDVSPMEVEDMACAMIAFADGPERAWSRLPVFALKNGPRQSFASLQRVAQEKRVLYLDSGETQGVDYSVFDAPVLDVRQPEGGLKLLKDRFQGLIVNLGLADLVMEAPMHSRPELGPREKNFQAHLGFSPNKLWTSMGRSLQNSVMKTLLKSSKSDLEMITGIDREHREAQADLAELEWRVSYLVERDGRTPCRTHLFLLKGKAVLLNLNHPEISRLLALSEKAAALTAHLAMALCLSDKKKLLRELTDEAREDLILMDAMIRCKVDLAPKIRGGEGGTQEEIFRREFKRDLEDVQRWID
jgi:hypothetical protein